jgi:hypothetical protein
MSFNDEYFINADYTKLRRNVQINYLRTKLIKPKSIAFEKCQKIEYNNGFDHKNFKHMTKIDNKNKNFSRHKYSYLNNTVEQKLTLQTVGDEKDYLANDLINEVDFKISFQMSLKDNQNGIIRFNVSDIKLKIKFKKLARIVCTLLSFLSYTRKKFTTKYIINDFDSVIVNLDVIINPFSFFNFKIYK